MSVDIAHYFEIGVKLTDDSNFDKYENILANYSSIVSMSLLDKLRPLKVILD